MASSREDHPMETESCVSRANTTFALNVMTRLGSDDKKANVIFSPFSISSALAMLMLGARGHTLKQMSQCLETEACQEDVHSNFNKVLSCLGTKSWLNPLSVANRLYGDKSFQVLEAFQTSSRDFYKADLALVDFRKNSEGARRSINDWVTETTKGKIKDLLAGSAVQSSTNLVLVNAIYFKARWEVEFLNRDTNDGEFRISKTKTKPVKMMSQKSRFPVSFVPELGFKILEMPYKGNNVSMLIFLPEEIEDDSTGLEKLERELTYENFVKWTRRDVMEDVTLRLYLPQFKLEENYNMKEVLTSIGMVDAFDPARSDFSGISSGEEFAVSDVVHKAYVAVNEKGTEAAGATSVMLLGSGLVRNEFKADHPFLFFIRHNPTSSLLFAGRFCSPE